MLFGMPIWIALIALLTCCSRGQDAHSAEPTVSGEAQAKALKPSPSRAIAQPVKDTPSPTPLAAPQRDLIHASRRTCSAPCPVFFDAISKLTWQEIEESTFSWDFEDEATFTGYMAAHVFELPEGVPKRTYRVSLIVKRGGTPVAKDSVTVSVQRPRGRTICVAKGNFSGCPSRSKNDRFTSLDAAWAAVRTHDRILLRRGDSFAPKGSFRDPVAGPVHLGAFGDANAPRPVVRQSERNWRIGSQWSMTDLDISGGGHEGALISIGGHHVLLMRCLLRDGGGAFVSDGPGYDFSTHKFIFDNTARNISGTSYLAGKRIAVVGNDMERLGVENGHTIRLGGAKYALFAGNRLVSPGGHTSLTVRGARARRPETHYVLVRNNVFVQPATVHPQNARADERLRYVIWERNLHVPHEGQTSSQNGLQVSGRDMVIRNNVFHQIRRAIQIETHPVVGPSQNIHVYQNTQFIDQDRDKKQWFCDAGPGIRGAVVKDNLAVLHTRSAGSRFITVDEGNRVGPNYSYTPGQKNLCQQPGGKRACADPTLANTSDPGARNFLVPKAGSLAVDAASTTLAAEDFRGTPRPQGRAADVGAIERTTR